MTTYEADPTKVAKVEKMRYHGPGWTIDVGDISVNLWAPNTTAEFWNGGHVDQKVRRHWACSWDDREGDDDAMDYENGATWQDAIAVLDTCPNELDAEIARHALSEVAEIWAAAMAVVS